MSFLLSSPRGVLGTVFISPARRQYAQLVANLEAHPRWGACRCREDWPLRQSWLPSVSRLSPCRQ